MSKLHEGKWVARNLDGKERRFSNPQDAEAWRSSRSPSKQSRMSFSDYLDSLEKEKQADKPSTWQIWNEFQNAVGRAFPDGDFIDYFGPYMRKHDISMDELDDAVKEHGGADGAYAYLQQMWDDQAADAEHDAMQGAHGDTYGGQWFQRPNPWK